MPRGRLSLGLPRSAARPLQRSTALALLSLSCFLPFCLLGLNRSAPSARAASAQNPSDCHRRIGTPRLDPFAFSAGRPPDRPLLLGPPRLAHPPIGFPGSDPLGVGPLASAPIDSVPRLDPLGSATPGAARPNLTYGLSKTRPLLVLQISATPVLGRFGRSVLRASTGA